MGAQWWRQPGFVLAARYNEHVARVLLANVVNNLVTLGASVFAARRLSVEAFAQYGVGVSIVLLGSLLLDVGLSTSLVRDYNFRYSGEDKGRDEVIHAALAWKLLLVGGLAGGGVPLAHVIVSLLPALGGAVSLVYLSAVTAGLLSLWSTVRATEQARRRYTVMAWYTYTYAGLRLFGFVIVLVAGTRSPSAYLIAVYSAPLLLLVVRDVLSVLRWALHGRRWRIARELQQLLGYGTWVWLSGLAYVMLTRLPQLVLARRGSAAEVALYNAGLTMLGGLSLLNDSVRTVLLPVVASQRRPEDRFRYRVRMRYLVPSAWVVMLLSVAALSVVQAVAFGPGYRESLAVTWIGGAGMATAAALGFHNILVHSYGLPALDTLVNFGRVALLGIALTLFLPATASGVAAGYAGTVVLGEVILWYLVKSLGKAGGSRSSSLEA